MTTFLYWKLHMLRLPHYEVWCQIGYDRGMTEHTGDLLFWAARSLRRRSGELLADFEITPAQSRALRLIDELEQPRPSELAERLRIAPRSATEVVDALESRSWVSRTRDPHDRRATCLSLTPTGQAVVGQVNAARTAAADEFLARLSTRERTALDSLLRKLMDR